MTQSSAIPGFFKLSISERQEKIQSVVELNEEDISVLKNSENSLQMSIADSMVENCISIHHIPIGVATNFLVDGKDVLVPMANEEPSVVAGASFAAKLCRPAGGFITSLGNNICTGQVVLIPGSSDSDPVSQVLGIKSEILMLADSTMPSMVSRGGGAVDLDVRLVETDSCPTLVIDLHVNVVDAMGANAVTTACELIQTFVSSQFGYEPLMGIVTNLSKKRVVHAIAKWHIKDLKTPEYDGMKVAERIIMAANLAKADPARAATHRKGIMNGVTAVVLATGNDTRAVESAVHTFALTEFRNQSLTEYRIDNNRDLVGEIWIPVPVGVVGGSIKRNKSTQVMKKMLRAETADALARVIASVGLAQNFAALKALVTSGISKGHMKLHCRNIAHEAGATELEIESLSNILISDGKISVSNARKLLQNMRCPLQ